MAETFTDAGASRDAFQVAWKGMTALGLIHVKSGIRFIGDDKPWTGRTSRFWPSNTLLALAASHGVTPNQAKGAFRAVASSKPPKVPEPISLRGPKQRLRKQRSVGETLPIDPGDPEAQRLLQTVLDHNALAAIFDVTGCTPPRWKRVFNMDWRLGGRWYAVGHDQATTYAYKPEEDRLRDIRINGEAVVEVDIKASHLTILHGLLGLPLPPHDPYTVSGDIGRNTAKAWLTTSLGRGRPSERWSGSTDKDLRTVRAGVVRDAMVATYPFLTDLLQVVPGDLRQAYPDEAALVSLYLQGVEAAALSFAIAYARSHGVLALPMHDGLIVPASAAWIADRGLKEGFQAAARITPRTDVEEVSSKALKPSPWVN
jgi:hypothetical protein